MENNFTSHNNDYPKLKLRMSRNRYTIFILEVNTMTEKEIVEKLREIAFNRMVKRDMWGISSEDINDEMLRILEEHNYGEAK